MRAAVIVLLLAGACGDSSSSDAAADAGAEVAIPPPRPSGEDTPGGEESTWALIDPVLEQNAGDAWETTGYDLDGLCTNQPDLDVECLPPSPSSDVVEDGALCRDNASGHMLFTSFESLVGTYEEVIVDTLRAGIGAPLLTVRGWSGEADDPNVEAGLAFATHGTSAPSPTATTVEISMGLPQVDGVPIAPPRLDGTDTYFADDRTWDAALGRPNVVVDDAYVSSFELVMRLPDRVEIRLGDEDLTTTLALTDAVLTASMGPDGVSSALLTGRWATVDILDRGLHLRASLCPGTRAYGFFQALLDIVADIRSVPGSGGSDEIVCDAVSVAIPFERAVRADVAGTATLIRPAPCE